VGAEGEAVNDDDGEPGVFEGLAPFGERRVGGDGDGGTLRSLGQDLEEQFGAARVQVDVVELIQAEQAEPAVTGDEARELAFVGEFVDHRGGGRVGDAQAALAGGDAESDPPGTEAKVDFGQFSAEFDGAPTELSMFVMRRSHSGRAVHVCSQSEGQEAFLEGHAIAFERYGGAPGRVRYDNLKAAAVRVLAGCDRVESDRFTAPRSPFGFDAFFCRPGVEGAYEKGGVEGEVRRFRRRHLVPVPRVGSLAEQNALRVAADYLDDEHHIGSRLPTVGQMAERPALRPLPAEPFDLTIPRRAKVDRKARISVRGSRYPMTAPYAGRSVDVRLGGSLRTARRERVECPAHDVAAVRRRRCAS